MSEPTHEDIRAGIISLRENRTLILSSDGESQLPVMYDGMMDPDLGGYFAFSKAIGSPVFDRLVADAKLVDGLAQAVFIEGLVREAERISGEKTYLGLQEEERLKLASFLYRPERFLTTTEMYTLVFPIRFDASAEVQNPMSGLNEKGLRKSLMMMLESPSLDIPPKKCLEDKWKENGWDKYIERSQKMDKIPERGEIHLRLNIDAIQTDNPVNVESLLVDITNYMRTYENQYDLNNAHRIAIEVFNARKNLYHNDYFMIETTLPDRFVMIQKVLEGKPIF